MKRFFLDERIILVVILINSAVIYLQECGYNPAWIAVVDVICTCLFAIEMIVKIRQEGWRDYWSSGWNRMDGTLVILSVPAVISYFVPTGFVDLSFLMILRILRVFRFFRTFHFFPNFTQIAKNFKRALRESFSVIVGFLILIVVFALISCALFKEAAPDYFETPSASIYSIFQLCTVEGWSDIPKCVSEGLSPSASWWVHLYFCLLLIVGGIIGMSLVNSIFVDAMVSDNNDGIEQKLREIEDKIDKLSGRES